MKQFLASALLILIIVSSGLYIFFFLSFNFLSKDNFININLRKQAAENLNTRKMFFLNKIGDGRSDFAQEINFNKLVINIYSNEGEGLQYETKQKILNEINRVIKKSEGITLKENNLKMEVFKANDLELHNLIKSYPIDLKNTAKINIFVLENYTPIPSYAGIVKDAYNIFIFLDPIQRVSSFYKTPGEAETSTILHEFAHLLGADHVENDNCILSEKVEDITRGRPTIIETAYCPEDLEEIKRAISN